MKTDRLSHDHCFLGRDHDRNARKVWLVIALTAGMMVVEIAAGYRYGSMALVADGWHMSTHAGAMLIAAFAYAYARKNAHHPRFTFGTGKLGDLAGFASAVALALVALLIGWDSLWRLIDPVPIGFDQAIAIAAVGLGVNLVSAWLLKDDHHHDQHDHHHHGHGHGPEHGHGRDNNLRAAYFHVLADALTSVLAIVALALGKARGWLWADPVMGVVGALVIARWSWGLIRDAGRVLLDAPAQGAEIRREIEQALAGGGGGADDITDLHVWQVGPGHFAAIVSLASAEPKDSSIYKALLADIHELSHVTVETRRAADRPAHAAS
jgi:cation diffusion facilitator family transporter